ncbi:hypothetical protein C8R47DRAFT_1212725 [Mycena vitilis]|nr:hypothetical protein C8R47DRAFT_1212725 [Mycena vitilis]
MATESEKADLECAQTVYAAVKNEFYAWKTEHTAQVFSRIATRDPPFVSGAMESFFLPVLEPLSNSELDIVLFEDYDADGKLVEPATAIPLQTAEAAQSFPPHPPYQFCTPVSRSHTARMIDNQSAAFIPYPEDASFPREDYLKEFQGFQWILDQQDPDKEVIQFETVRRLHLNHGFSVEHIDHLITAYTSLRSLRLSNESGLLWDVSQRAVIHKHSGLNYCFGMKGTTIDAQWAGNPMRFLNDSKPRKPNCRAEEMVVNDERRIVIRAVVRIEAGKELTLDYGKTYWGQSGPRAEKQIGG